MNLDDQISAKDFKNENTELTKSIEKAKERIHVITSEIEKINKVIKLTSRNLPSYNFDVFKQYVKDYLEFVRIHEVKHESK